ncbi:MAG: hypothetical protein IKO61_12205 [Lachnospiraceae bacterium]|nr:hypothetical protein [Lachnospiraceae bacterium]
MAETREIQVVKDNYEKQNTYRIQKGRYNKAIKDGYYFEALLIVYALLEDRLRSFIYYIGGISSHTSSKLDTGKTIKDNLRAIYFGSAEKAEGKNLSLSVISNKIRLVSEVVDWVINAEGELEDDYLKVLKKELEGCVDLDGTQQVLKKVSKWIKYRNEIMHALMNKKVEDLQEQLCDKVVEGMELVDFLDNQVKSLRRSKGIRKKMKLGVEYR